MLFEILRKGNPSRSRQPRQVQLLSLATTALDSEHVHLLLECKADFQEAEIRIGRGGEGGGGGGGWLAQLVGTGGWQWLEGWRGNCGNAVCFGGFRLGFQCSVSSPTAGAFVHLRFVPRGCE